LVGNNKRTYLKDYSDATTKDTAFILKIESSNYYNTQLNNDVELFGLVELSRNKNIPLVVNVQSGLIIDLEDLDMPSENTVPEALKHGADLVTFGGDKLFGGPQSGIIAGKKSFIDLISKNPLNQAFRPGKLTLSALEATLQLYFNTEISTNHIPILKFLTKNITEIESDARKLFEELKLFPSIECGVKKALTDTCNNVQTDIKLPTYIIWIKHKTINASELYHNFLHNHVITILKDDTILLDPRCLLRKDLNILSMAFDQVLK
jgi:L-seryl-tRNA(Ser) seleniumtransferase